MNRNPSSRGSILYIIGISLIAALGGFLFGFDMTVVSGTVPFLKYFFHLDAAGLGWAVSSCILAWCLRCPRRRANWPMRLAVKMS